MRRMGILPIVLIVMFSVGSVAEPEKQAMPEKLAETYRALVKAMRAGEFGVIEKLSLPHSVLYADEKREKPEYGRDINSHFSRDGFDDTVVILRKDGEGCYLIRTNTSALWFIETKEMGWRLYRYMDKPIE